MKRAKLEVTTRAAEQARGEKVNLPLVPDFLS